MSFWRNFGFYTVSSIETTLNKPDFTLEDLLDDEEILQEVKAQNKKLIDVYVSHRLIFSKNTCDPGVHVLRMPRACVAHIELDSIRFSNASPAPSNVALARVDRPI